MFDQKRFDACVDWFYANRDSLLPQYHGKYVVCSTDKVLGAWGSFALAVANAADMGYHPGEFAVQHCVTDQEAARVRVYTLWVDFSKTNKDHTAFSFRIPSEGSAPSAATPCCAAEDFLATQTQQQKGVL